MRNPILFAGLLLLAGAVISAEVQIDDDFMRTVEDTNKSLASNIALQNAKDATLDAKELEKMFAQVEAFYVKKGDAPDGVELSHKSKELAVEITQLVAAKNFDTANERASALSRTCKTCHNFYKKD